MLNSTMLDYKAYIRVLIKSLFVKWAGSAWVIVCTYDTILSQFIPEQFANTLPRAWQIALVTGGILPILGWLLILAAIIAIGSLEYAIKIGGKPIPKVNPDIWVYDAAHYIVTRSWKAEQIVGYGKEIMRLRNEGTTLWRSEMNVQTGEQKHIKLTPEEEALAIRNTRVEKVNNALEEIRRAAIDGFPVWTKQDSDKAPELIDNAYWERYSFEKIVDLKQTTPEGLRTFNKQPPNNKPIYHSLRTSKSGIEEIWPP